MQMWLPNFLITKTSMFSGSLTLPLMLDLFCGRGGASAAFRQLGWDVVGIDINPRLRPDIVADLRNWSWAGRRPDLVWASVPCQEFARFSMPWTRAKNPAPPSMELFEAAKRIIGETGPRFWAIENVRGAAKFFGPPARRLGAVYLWGTLPPHFPDFKVAGFKESLSGKDPQARSVTPFEISLALALYTSAAVHQGHETLTRWLGRDAKGIGSESAPAHA